MSVQLNHTIVHSKNKFIGAKFMSEILGLGEPKPFAHFLVVQASNGISLDFMDQEGEVPTQHYAFLVSDEEFDQIFLRIKAKGLTYWADPMRTEKSQVNHRDGGQGLYFEDPSGHLLEILTRPYGSGKTH